MRQSGQAAGEEEGSEDEELRRAVEVSPLAARTLGLSSI